VSFIYGLEEKNSKSEVIFAVCHLLTLTSCLTSLICNLKVIVIIIWYLIKLNCFILDQTGNIIVMVETVASVQDKGLVQTNGKRNALSG